MQLRATALLPYGQHAIVQQEIRLREERGLLSVRLVLTGHAAECSLSPKIKFARALRLDCHMRLSFANQDRAPPNHMNTHTVTNLAVPKIILSSCYLSLLSAAVEFSFPTLLPLAPLPLVAVLKKPAKMILSLSFTSALFCARER